MENTTPTFYIYKGRAWAKTNTERSESIPGIGNVSSSMCQKPSADFSALILSYLTTPFPAEHWYLRPKLSLVCPGQNLELFENCNNVKGV